MITFLFVGPPKSGTTYIHHILRQNPSIFLPEKKEVQFFNHNFLKGVEWYHAHYTSKQPNQIAGEISPTYCDSLETLKKIRQYADTYNSGRMKLVLTYRDPLKRLLSEYHHNIRKANYDHPIGTAVKLEFNGEGVGKYYKIVRNSRYFEITKELYSLFTPEDILFIDSDKEIYDANIFPATIAKIERFIGADKFNGYNFDVEDNASYVPRSYVLQKLIFQQNGFKKTMKYLIPSFKLRSKIRIVLRKFNRKKDGYDTSESGMGKELSNIYYEYLEQDFKLFTEKIIDK